MRRTSHTYLGKEKRVINEHTVDAALVAVEEPHSLDTVPNFDLDGRQRHVSEVFSQEIHGSILLRLHLD